MEKEKIEIIGAVVTVITAFITSLVGPSIVEYIKVKIDIVYNYYLIYK